MSGRDGDGERRSVARRVSSADRGASAAPARAAGPDRAWVLRIAPAMLALPLVWSLLRGNVVDVVALAIALVLFYAAMWLVESGLAAEAEYAARELIKAPRPPRKLLGAVVVALATFVAGMFASGAGLPLSLLLGAIAGIGALMAYGMDPTKDKGLAPDLARKAGVRTEQVIEAVGEAEAKIRDIEQWAGRLHNRELTGRLHRIVDRARAVLAQIQKDPSDLRRARRFLVTYLDGTRDVVKKYTERQQDLAGTELGESFRHVLDTIEQVFGEQIEVLERNDTMDLEVQIEVLRTQLEREGVH
jgi:hypothetical protein